ncbi:acyltransferase [Microbacterium sp. NE2HP2]|uniref:acyltransferase family protein n=1 Tax=Microbacterium plantarum TaxID=1816425 RepID=UPI002366B130|nr:acyltransferase [Microbacterium plantarum]MDD7945821.1 acyltransferase [Microbacterium plantarum]
MNDQEQFASSPAALNRAQRFAHIDAMRAFAVLLVVVGHAGLGRFVPGGSGVTIFFAISGFIITYMVIRERERTHTFRAGRFYFRRAMKLFPPLLIVIIVPTLIYSLFASVDWWAFFAQIAFFFNWFKAQGGADVLPGSGVVWSLAIEEQFYLVFAAIWLLAYRSRKYHAILVTLAIVSILTSNIIRFVIIGSGEPLAAERIYYSTDTRLDSISWGVLAASLLHIWQVNGSRPSRFSQWFASPLALIFAALLFLGSLVLRDDWFRDTLRFPMQSIAASMVITYGLLPGTGATRQLFYRASTLRWVSMIGLASYSVYLVHLPLMGLIMPFVEQWPLLLRAITLSTFTTAAGILAYLIIERPALRARDRLERWYSLRTQLSNRK